MEKAEALIHWTLISQRREKRVQNHQRAKKRRRRTGNRATQENSLVKRDPKNRNSQQIQKSLKEQKTDNLRLMLTQLKSKSRRRMKMSKNQRNRRLKTLNQKKKRKRKRITWQLRYHQMIKLEVKLVQNSQWYHKMKGRVRFLSFLLTLPRQVCNHKWRRGRWTKCSWQRKPEKSRKNFWTIQIKSLSDRTVWILLLILRTSWLKPHQEGSSKSC